MESPASVYPVRARVPWIHEEGRVVVLLPKRLGPVARAARTLSRGPTHVRVPLDELGSRAFLLADGSRTAEGLASELSGHFGERAGPPERALAFLGILARNRLVELARAPTPAPEPPLERLRELGCVACGRAFHAAEAPGTRLRCPGCGGRVLA